VQTPQASRLGSLRQRENCKNEIAPRSGRSGGGGFVRVAVLFADAKGIYANSGVDLWDITRDARHYPGPAPVIAHPPCAVWCQLAAINEKRYGHKRGEDGGCFAAALASVRRWGGILEHPANTLAWAAFKLPRPSRGMWLFDGRGYVTVVSQAAYGHAARKLTWLYYVGKHQPPRIDWSYTDAKAWVSYCVNHGDTALRRLSKREASATPAAFRDLLLEIAARSAEGDS